MGRRKGKEEKEAGEGGRERAEEKQRELKSGNAGWRERQSKGVRERLPFGLTLVGVLPPRPQSFRAPVLWPLPQDSRQETEARTGHCAHVNRG